VRRAPGSSAVGFGLVGLISADWPGSRRSIRALRDPHSEHTV
jgi:hypothetical protein